MLIADLKVNSSLTFYRGKRGPVLTRQLRISSVGLSVFLITRSYEFYHDNSRMECPVLVKFRLSILIGQEILPINFGPHRVIRH